jgi:hypothetical protein
MLGYFYKAIQNKDVAKSGPSVFYTSPDKNGETDMQSLRYIIIHTRYRGRKSVVQH